MKFFPLVVNIVFFVDYMLHLSGYIVDFVRHLPKADTEFLEEVGVAEIVSKLKKG